MSSCQVEPQYKENFQKQNAGPMFGPAFLFDAPKPWILFLVPVVAEIAIAVAVPVMIVLETAAVAFPKSREELPAFITRPDPVGAGIGRTGPVSVMPPIASSFRIPIPVYPKIIWSGGSRPGANHTRRRRWPNSHPNRYLREARTPS